MRITLALTHEQAEQIITAWSTWKPYGSDSTAHYLDRDSDAEPDMANRNRVAPAGKSAWTDGPSGYLAGENRHRWLSDEFDLSEVVRQPDGNWIFCYNGARERAARLTWGHPSLPFRSLPVLEY
ncbi:MAG: hypothetical protein VKP72_11550, partial [bacterium]|nr:hypothetical protein [bacterium]